MKKEQILNQLNRLRLHLNDDLIICNMMKKNTESDLLKVGTNRSDLDNRIEKHKAHIKELEELIFSIEKS